MSMMKLAFFNAKNSILHYRTLILSQAFSVLVLFNFQHILYSGSFAVLGSRNQEYVEMLVQMVSFVLGCFMFFFLWYSTNVFLTRRKKEIGTYIFMGLSNEKIGQMYLVEAVLVGLCSLGLGLFSGAVCTGLFQMVLLKISGLAVEIQFFPGVKPFLTTTAVYLLIDLVFAVKGYVDITRSSILGMLSAARQSEDINRSGKRLVLQAVLGTAVLGCGYYLALKKGSASVMGNAFLAVILVTAGVYLLFGGMVPAVFQSMAADKKILYRGKRILWMNSMRFRIRKNYRTYAMVCILMLCSVTALAMGFALKGRYEAIIRFEHTYTFQLFSKRGDLNQQAEELIRRENEIRFSSRTPVLLLDPSLVKASGYDRRYGILPFSSVKKLAQDSGLEFTFAEPGDDQVIKVSHLYLMSMITQRAQVAVNIDGKDYVQVEDTSVPYLGYLQENMAYYLVNDRVYRKLLPRGEEYYAYNYRVEDPERFEQTKERLNELVDDRKEGWTARIAIDPKSNELDWIRVLYTICLFMFLVFVLAGGSIMFMKLYNDGFEEKERCQVILKLGFDREVLKQSIQAELAAAYGITFFVMAVSSFFSVRALGNMMFTDLTGVNLASLGAAFMIFSGWYILSVKAYERIAVFGGGIQD